MMISLIVAMDRNRGIGFENTIPWLGKVPADMKRFRQITMSDGHRPVVMGRKTYDSMGKALPDRENIVLSRHAFSLNIPDARIYTSIIRIAEVGHYDEILVIGGGEIFAQSLPFAHRMYLTIIDAEFPADAFFPAYDPSEWSESERIVVPADEKNLFPMTFLTLDRI